MGLWSDGASNHSLGQTRLRVGSIPHNNVRAKQLLERLNVSVAREAVQHSATSSVDDDGEQPLQAELPLASR